MKLKHCKLNSNCKFQISNYQKVGFLGLTLVAIVALILLRRVVSVKAAPWPSTMADWAKRKQETLVNNSGQTLSLHLKVNLFKIKL